MNHGVGVGVGVDGKVEQQTGVGRGVGVGVGVGVGRGVGVGVGVGVGRGVGVDVGVRVGRGVGVKAEHAEQKNNAKLRMRTSMKDLRSIRITPYPFFLIRDTLPFISIINGITLSVSMSFAHTAVFFIIQNAPRSIHILL